MTWFQDSLGEVDWASSNSCLGVKTCQTQVEISAPGGWTGSSVSAGSTDGYVLHQKATHAVIVCDPTLSGWKTPISRGIKSKRKIKPCASKSFNMFLQTMKSKSNVNCCRHLETIGVTSTRLCRVPSESDSKSVRSCSVTFEASRMTCRINVLSRSMRNEGAWVVESWTTCGLSDAVGHPGVVTRRAQLLSSLANSTSRSFLNKPAIKKKKLERVKKEKLPIDGRIYF